MSRPAHALALAGEERVTFERAARQPGYGPAGANGSALHLPPTMSAPLTALVGRDETLALRQAPLHSGA
jgi:hypothetical protein